ncbi:MAG: class II fructose-1,6-bisphosphate aldolase [Mycoplasmataceae bacterium]|nr:class II fructose-1,6-bisphosphate aldolase [Mycoplasmataceae bacterium]
MSNFVNAKHMLDKALEKGYAVAHINLNNLEWIKSILEAAQASNTPVIIGVSEGAVKYNCGYKNVADMVKNSMEFLKVTVDVCLHLDHGSYEGCKQAIAAGFTSVMFDGSHETIEENIKKTSEIVELAHKFNISVEGEVGGIGGTEDSTTSLGEIADVAQCQQLVSTGIDCLAAGIGNIHGVYPQNWKGLDFQVLAKIHQILPTTPLVLHGGSGIDEEQIRKAISLGIAKINVNTECQIAFANAIAEYCQNKKHLNDKGYDPRKLLKVGCDVIKEVCVTKFKLFGSFGKN